MGKLRFAFGITIGAVLVVLALQYFYSHSVAVLNPQGPIAAQQRQLIITATLLMLIVVIPVFILTFVFAWKYRAGNTKARYAPDWDHNRFLELSWWAIPTVIIAVLAIIAWKSSHTLDPYKPIAASSATMVVQVVALDWKWLFIYPQQGIATVNYVRVPVGTPIDFQITSDAPMNSFWIPQLGGQIYAMPGMSAQLNLLAAAPGNFRGSSANLSGQGFADMSFTATASSHADFDRWVDTARRSPNQLTQAAYDRLAQPSQDSPEVTYASPQPGLYDAAVYKYMSPTSLSGIAQ